MDPGILALFIPIIAILGGCSIAVAKIMVSGKKNALSDGQVMKLMEKIEALDSDNQSLKGEMENLRLIASEDYHALPPSTDDLIERKIEEVIRKKALLSEKNK